MKPKNVTVVASVEELYPFYILQKRKPAIYGKSLVVPRSLLKRFLANEKTFQNIQARITKLADEQNINL